MRLRWSVLTSLTLRESVCVHNLTATTALGGTTPRLDQHGPITLSEEPGYALASVAARKGGERATVLAIRRIIGPAVPKPNHVAGDTVTAFWTGPNQWMLEAPYDSHETLFATARAEVKGKASITEQTGGWCRFDLRGVGLAKVLERLCPINMNKFQPGDATRTSIDHLGCFVVCRTLGHISIIGPRSSANSLHHGLLTAIRSAY